jgi:hypothetical protein
MTRKIKVTSEQLEEMYEQSQEKEYLSVKGFEGWSFFLDEDDFEYDREHGAQVEFLMTLTSPDDTEYVARAGYENEGVSMCFNYDVYFEEVSKTIPIKNKKIRFSVNMTVDFTLDESVEDTEINKTAVEAMFNAYLQHNLKEVKVFRSNYEF